MFVLGMLFSAAGLFLVRNAGADAGNRRKESGDGHLPFLSADGRTVWAVLSVVLFLAGWGRMTMEVKPRPIERYLAEAEKNGEVVTVAEDLPKSFLLTSEFGMDRVYLCQFNAATLEKRMK